jgi:hypothetical protein
MQVFATAMPSFLVVLVLLCVSQVAAKGSILVDYGGIRDFLGPNLGLGGNNNPFDPTVQAGFSRRTSRQCRRYVHDQGLDRVSSMASRRRILDWRVHVLWIGWIALQFFLLELSIRFLSRIHHGGRGRVSIANQSIWEIMLHVIVIHTQSILPLPLNSIFVQVFLPSTKCVSVSTPVDGRM